MIESTDCLPFFRRQVLCGGLLAALLLLVCGGVCPLFTPLAAAEETTSSAAEAEAAKAEAQKTEAEKAPARKPAADADEEGQDKPKKTNDEKSNPPAEEDSEEAAPDKKAKEEKSKPSAKEDSQEPAPSEDEDADVEVEIVDDSEEEEPEESVSTEPKPPVTEEPKVEEPKVQKRVIGATATIMEKKSEILFRARIDTGAKSCSLHVEDVKIENESEVMAENIGKVVRFHIVNGNKESHWLEAKIARYVIVKTSNDDGERNRRYKVPLTFRWKDVEKTVLVTLNDREHMDYPLLIGRNFLKSDFVVDVELDSDD